MEPTQLLHHPGLLVGLRVMSFRVLFNTAAPVGVLGASKMFNAGLNLSCNLSSVASDATH